MRETNGMAECRCTLKAGEFVLSEAATKLIDDRIAAVLLGTINRATYTDGENASPDSDAEPA